MEENKCKQCNFNSPKIQFFYDRNKKLVCESCYMENTDSNKKPLK